MKKLCSFMPLLFLIVSCAAAPVDNSNKTFDEDKPFLNTAPSDGGLVFLGITGIRSNPKETIQFAFEDAARRVAVFHWVSGEYLSANHIGSSAFDYSNTVRTALRYDTESAARYAAALTFDADTDALETENTFIIRARYNAALPRQVDYRPAYSGTNKKPDWVENQPARIGGYETGVGYAGRHSTLAETCRVSYNNAIFAVIRNLNGASRAGDTLFQGSGLYDYKTASNQLLYASGFLKNFYALDMWIDSANKAVWTLAIALQSEGESVED